ncbi:hypothetical protein NT05LM_0601 [Listeria marthii FSL S4-120]|uniref:Uncharacterized protein n=1 Tax=Listeria marthii FSL S4-120 TaxID=702457 RepID=A0ABN0C008_9LIST|nr:hypothetical protein NT05LM_0601 [Listeria marthii FSL S4-120]
MEKTLNRRIIGSRFFCGIEHNYSDKELILIKRINNSNKK